MNKSKTLQPEGWVNKYADGLFSYTRLRVNDSPAAEDIVQETFLSAWKARDSYQGQASEKNWLYAICKNKIIDYYRKQSSAIVKTAVGDEKNYFDEVEHWTPVTRPNEWGIDYSQPVETKEFYTVLEKCKQKLKDIQQMVFIMRYLDDLDSDDICKALDLTPSYYWVLIHRAKLQLRRCLEKKWINIQ